MPRTLSNAASHASLARHPYLGASLLGVLSLPIHVVLPMGRSHELAAILLAVIAGVYLGFAIRDGRSGILALEGAVTVAFGGFAFAALAYAPSLLPAGYLAHGFWDLAHHRQGVATRLPAWYVPACVVYDWTVGLFLWLWWL